MPKKHFFLLSLLFVFHYANADLPPFIKPCSKTSPWLQFCILNQVPVIMKWLKTGFPEWGMKPLDPIEIRYMDMPFDRNLRMSIGKFKVTGLSKATFEYLMVDPFRNLFEIRVRFPQLSAQGRYRVKGHIFSLPVNSGGSMTLTFGDIVFEARIQLRVIERDNEFHYTTPKRPIPGRDMDVQINKANLYLENLIPYDQELNDRYNEVIRKGFFPFFDRVKPGIVSVIWQLARRTVEPILRRVSLDELFAE